MSTEKKQQFALSWKWVAATVFFGVLGCALWALLSRWAMPALIGLISSTSSHLTDHIYHLASNGLHEYSSIIANTTFQFFLCSLAVIGGVFTFVNSKQRMNQLKSLKNIKTIQQSSDNKDPSEELTIDSIKEQIDDITREYRKAYIKALCLFGLYCLCAIYVLSTIILIDLSTTIAAQTLHNIDIIAPYVSNHEYKLLISDFYQMSSKADYDALMKTVIDVADKNGLTLKQ